MENNSIKTGDHWLVDRWVKCWPDGTAETVAKNIPDYKETVIFRCSTGKPSIAPPLGKDAQLVVNYNYHKNCFIVWNAAVQSYIHRGKKICPYIGAEGEERMHKEIAPDSIEPFFRKLGRGGSNEVELVLIVGVDALEKFCKNYMEYLRPDIATIPKGKQCLYAVAGRELERISAQNHAF